MRKIIDFTDTVISQVNYIKERRGLKTFTATLHSIISEYYEDKYFTKYGNQRGGKNDPAQPVENLSPEQICEALGGKILNDKCDLPYMNSRMEVPLTMMGTKSAAGDYRLKK